MPQHLTTDVLICGAGAAGPVAGDRPRAVDRSRSANSLVGRDYTTVSRQVAKLEGLGLVARRARKADRRVTEAVVTDQGQALSDALDAARGRPAGIALAGWSENHLKEFARLLRRFTDNLMHGPSDL